MKALKIIGKAIAEFFVFIIAMIMVIILLPFILWF